MYEMNTETVPDKDDESRTKNTRAYFTTALRGRRNNINKVFKRSLSVKFINKLSTWGLQSSTGKKILED